MNFLLLNQPCYKFGQAQQQSIIGESGSFKIEHKQDWRYKEAASADSLDSHVICYCCPNVSPLAHTSMFELLWSNSEGKKAHIWFLMSHFDILVELLPNLGRKEVVRGYLPNRQSLGKQEKWPKVRIYMHSGSGVNSVAGWPRVWKEKFYLLGTRNSEIEALRMGAWEWKEVWGILDYILTFNKKDTEQSGRLKPCLDDNSYPLALQPATPMKAQLICKWISDGSRDGGSKAWAWHMQSPNYWGWNSYCCSWTLNVPSADTNAEFPSLEETN